MTKMNKKYVAVLGLAACIQGNAIAAIHSYDFTSTIQSMFEHNGAANKNTTVSESTLTGTRLSIGNIVHGRLSFDDAAQSPYDANGSSDGYLVFSNAVTSFSFTVSPSSYAYQSEFGLGSQLLLSDSSTNPSGWDNFSAYSWAAYNPATFQSADINLFDKSGTAFNGYQLPSSLSLASFHYSNLSYAWLRRSDGNQFHFSGAITSLTEVSAVPEASSLLMLAGGLLVLAVQRRRRV